MNTRGLFITGTDTGVGKTYITCIAAREERRRGTGVGVYKPACSGAERRPDGSVAWSDLQALEEASEFQFPAERICPQRFLAPLAPPVAAQAENRTVDSALLREGARWWEGRVDLLLIEGVGGLLCPITEIESVADLAADLRYPLLIVARRGLGTINHTLLTVEAAQRRGLSVAGIVLNESEPCRDDPAIVTNEREIARRCNVPILGVLRHGEADQLNQENRSVEIPWLTLARIRHRSA